MKILKIITYCLLTSLLLSVNSATAKSDSEELSLLLSKYQSLTANFSETITDETGNIMQKARGDVSIKRPDHLRWYTKNPTPQLIIADGERLWIYDIDLEQVTIENLHRMSKSAPAMLLSGSAQKLENNYVIESQFDTDSQKFKLTPKTNEDLVQWIELDFQQGKITQMRLKNQLNQITSLNFKRVELNPKMMKNAFHFNPPRGVDVIDNSDS